MIGMTTTQINKIFQPLDWQVAPWRDKSFIVLLDGPAGTGKSHVWAYKMDALMRKYPGAMGLIVRKTRESMTNSTLLFLEYAVIGDDPHVKLKRQMKRFEYANGSILAYGGMKDENQREAIRSIGVQGGVDFIWIEEAHQLKLADFEELLPRLRGNAAGWRQMMLSTNPDSDMHWIYQRLIKGGEASRYIAQTKDNIHNPDDYAEGTLGRLTGVRRKRLKDGAWVGAEGAVYEDYRYEVHVIDPFEIPAEWVRFRSIDFGYRNPFVCQWWAVDEDGRMYLYREIYMSERTVAAHADEIKRLEARVAHQVWDELDPTEKNARWYGAESERALIRYTVADHDAEDRATLHENGIHTRSANKAITVGIEKVQERLIEQGDGRARIYFFNDALNEMDERLIDAKKPISTVDEISSYVYPPGVDGKPVKEQPVDVDNHGMDAMRYAAMIQDGASGKMEKSELNLFRRGRR